MYIETLIIFQNRRCPSNRLYHRSRFLLIQVWKSNTFGLLFRGLTIDQRGINFRINVYNRKAHFLSFLYACLVFNCTVVSSLIFLLIIFVVAWLEGFIPDNFSELGWIKAKEPGLDWGVLEMEEWISATFYLLKTICLLNFFMSNE